MSKPLSYPVVEMSDEQIAREKAVFGSFTQSVRDLVDATVLTRLDLDEVAALQAQVEAITARLRADQRETSYGVELTTTGRVRPHGNAVMGLRNAVAPPLKVERSDEGWARSNFRLGAAYEGPPTCVHGGVIALVLDQIMGEAASAGGRPGMTGTLTIRYERNTPLGDCSAKAWITERAGVKTYVEAELRDAEDNVTVTAHGVFILPKWARERLAERAAPGDAP